MNHWWFWGAFILLVTIVIWWRQHNQTKEEFEWKRRTMDQRARANHACKILNEFADTELANARIQIVSDTCEGGLPHTMDPNTVRMTEDVWNSGNRDNILRHERVHLLQKRNPVVWENFYRLEWEYRIYSTPPAEIAEQEALLRGNPDTAEKPWACWRNRYWFAPFYHDEQRPTLLGAPVRIWDSGARIGTGVKGHSPAGRWISEPPAEWRTFFCADGKCPYQYEHPHEIAAELWTRKEFQTPAGAALLAFLTGKNIPRP